MIPIELDITNSMGVFCLTGNCCNCIEKLRAAAGVT